MRSKCVSGADSSSSTSKSTALVQPIITPRFAISCSDELLEGLGKMLKEDPSLPCQTHLAENPTEISFTKCEWSKVR